MTGAAPGPLAGSAVVVTGSTRGLGRAFVQALAAAGAAVVVNGTSQESTDLVVAEIRQTGATATGFAGSVADHGFCRELIEGCVSTFGRVDMLVNNAGITRDRSFAKMTAAEFDEVVAVHLRGTFSCSSAAAQAMRTAGTGGRILNITSGSGLFGMFGQANYAAAKAGIVGLTRVMDAELHRHGIAVNCLAPVAATDMTGIFDADGGVTHSQQFPSPESVAPVVVHLARASIDVHGQCLSFDGTDLSVWSHPRATATWSRESGWQQVDFDNLPIVEALQFPNPDRWGSGAGKG
ncbi:SDR family NAD(P)-dependent oxidoreductase [Gordonia sp. TBRC 11910]|uniref:SDR family NAD(P)-dependent oxidoreductase n=1 Tax=Gordonia asplenii TaxID=2725283 RepID=A0A848KR15_9ACTN|nr:SDR family NAD(P)-dependent oxidoreductase [Gordonia asplenii]NMO01424.1 SDR family NAD(P)-dependent oxidoreductase [Gordonia asplenii]